MIRPIQKRFVNFSHVVIKGLRSIRIFHRLLIAFFVLIILPSLFITFFTYNKYVNEIETNMEKFLSLLVQNVNVQITDKLNSFERSAVQFYSDSTMIGGLQSGSDEDHITVGRKLNSIAVNNGYITNLQVVTPSDEFTMMDEYGERSGGYIRDLERFRESEYYTGAVEQHGYPIWFDTSKVSDLFYKSKASKYGMTDLITMTQAIYNMETREFVGVLVLNIKIGVLTDALKSYAFYGSGNTFLSGPNGVIMGINLSILEPNFSTASDVGRLISNEQEGVFNGKMDGANVSMVYKTVPYTDLSVVHIVDKDKLLQPAYRIRDLCLSIVAVLIMLSIIVAYWTTVSISRPLNKLMKAMKRFPRNEFHVNYTASGHDEITLLGEQFIKMADHTKELIDKIYVAEIKQKTLELNQVNAELNVLQMQINPHFLYNTLDMIRWEAMYEAGGESKATRMIDDFCRLMRMTIHKSEDIVPIDKELAHALTYIDVVNFRHRDKITLHMDFAFNTENYLIPRLTIQPLIENAVVHAFQEVGAEARIHIQGTIDHSGIVIRVTDNGRGITTEKLKELTAALISENSPRESIALYNVNQRMKLLYGESYGLEIISELGSGTTVQINLPAVTVWQ